MSEALSLFAALLSALAAAVGTAVSVAQWRQTRAPKPARLASAMPGPTTSQAPGQPADAAPKTRPGRRSRAIPPSERSSRGDAAPRSRAALSAAVLATVCCVFTAASFVVYLRQQAEDADASLESLIGILLPVALLSSVGGAAVAIFVGLRGLVRRRGSDIRIAAVTFALCLTPWIAFWITDLINDANAS